MSIDHAISLDPQEKDISRRNEASIEIDIPLDILNGQNRLTCTHSSYKGN
jgi:hypothetical protein